MRAGMHKPGLDALVDPSQGILKGVPYDGVINQQQFFELVGHVLRMNCGHQNQTGQSQVGTSPQMGCHKGSNKATLNDSASGSTSGVPDCKARAQKVMELLRGPDNAADIQSISALYQQLTGDELKLVAESTVGNALPPLSMECDFNGSNHLVCLSETSKEPTQPLSPHNTQPGGTSEGTKTTTAVTPTAAPTPVAASSSELSAAQPTAERVCAAQPTTAAQSGRECTMPLETAARPAADQCAVAPDAARLSEAERVAEAVAAAQRERELSYQAEIEAAAVRAAVLQPEAAAACPLITDLQPDLDADSEVWRGAAPGVHVPFFVPLPQAQASEAEAGSIKAEAPVARQSSSGRLPQYSDDDDGDDDDIDPNLALDDPYAPSFPHVRPPPLEMPASAPTSPTDQGALPSSLPSTGAWGSSKSGRRLAPLSKLLGKSVKGSDAATSTHMPPGMGATPVKLDMHSVAKAKAKLDKMASKAAAERAARGVGVQDAEIRNRTGDRGLVYTVVRESPYHMDDFDEDEDADGSSTPQGLVSVGNGQAEGSKSGAAQGPCRPSHEHKKHGILGTLKHKLQRRSVCEEEAAPLGNRGALSLDESSAMGASTHLGTKLKALLQGPRKMSADHKQDFSRKSN